MVVLEYFTSATILVVVLSSLATANSCYPFQGCEIYKELRKALLTEDNIYLLQTLFYPSDGSVISEADFQVTVNVQHIINNNNYADGAFKADENCGCFDVMCKCRMDKIHIVSTNSVEIKRYLGVFMLFVNLTDVSFYNMLALLLNYQDNYDPWIDYGDLDLELFINNLTDNPDIDTYHAVLLSLLTWVSIYAT